MKTVIIRHTHGDLETLYVFCTTLVLFGGVSLLTVFLGH